MKANFAILAAADLMLLMLVSALGLMVDGQQGFARHVYLGVLAALFTCFVHLVAFVYFVVQDKIVKQAVTADGVDRAFVVEVDVLKARSLHRCVAGIVSVLVVAGLGAAIEGYVAPLLHMLAAFGAILLNAILFLQHYDIIDQHGRVFARALGGGSTPWARS